MPFDIRTYAEAHLGRIRDSRGSEIEGECPVCEKFGSFYLNTDSGAFICFRCDFRGKSVAGLVAQCEGVSWSKARQLIFREGAKFRRKATVFSLADRLASVRPHAVREDAEKACVPLPSGFIPCYREGRYSMPKWLTRKRKIERRTARAWGLGYCNHGKYAHRLIVPISCPNGQSFTARDMTEKAERKYLNPWDVDQSTLLIGWDLVPIVGDVTLCEGPFDAVRLWQNDIPALALGGKELHATQRDLLVSHFSPETSITIMLDPEEKSAPAKVAAGLQGFFKSLYIARLPEGIDPGAASLAIAQRAVEDAPQWKGSRQYSLARLRELVQ